MAKVVMYATGWCPYCERARALLTRKGRANARLRVLEGGHEGFADAAQAEAAVLDFLGTTLDQA